MKRLPPHIARIDYARIFAPAFRDVRASRQFYESLRGGTGEDRYISRCSSLIRSPGSSGWRSEFIESREDGRPYRSCS